MSELENKPVLEYRKDGRRSGRWRIVRRIVLISLLAAAVYWHSELWYQIRLRWQILALYMHQQRIARMVVPEEVVVEFKDGIANPSRQPSEGRWTQEHDSFLHQLDDYERFIYARPPGNTTYGFFRHSGERVLLIAPLRTPKGETRFVSILANGEGLTHRFWRAGTRASAPYFYPDNFGSNIFRYYRLPSPKPKDMQLLSGSFDPARPSEFRIPYTIDGVRHEMVGHLQDGLRIRYSGDAWTPAPEMSLSALRFLSTTNIASFNDFDPQSPPSSAVASPPVPE